MLRLDEFPYVLVRLRCRRCERHGQYRLARLAERFGAGETLSAVMEALSAECPQRAEWSVRSTIYPCGIHCPDLGPPPRPPDVPPQMMPLRVIEGGVEDVRLAGATAQTRKGPTRRRGGPGQV